MKRKKKEKKTKKISFNEDWVSPKLSQLKESSKTALNMQLLATGYRQPNPVSSRQRHSLKIQGYSRATISKKIIIESSIMGALHHRHRTYQQYIWISFDLTSKCIHLPMILSNGLQFSIAHLIFFTTNIMHFEIN